MNSVIPARTPTSADETRFLRERLALTYEVGLGVGLFTIAATAAVTLFFSVGYQPTNLHHAQVLELAAVGICALARWVLRRGELRPRAVMAVDATAFLLVTTLYNAAVAHNDDRLAISFSLALVTGLMILLRAIFVPTTAARTLLAGLAAYSGATAVFVLSGRPWWPVHQVTRPDWTEANYAAYFGIWAGVVLIVAAVTAHRLHMLRREVAEAKRLGQYVLGGKLGEGGMGLVYKATHALLRRETAIKLLPADRFGPEAVRRFEREVVETARLRHPNTVAIYDYGRTPEGVFYYAMEYLDGLNLAELVAYAGPLPAGRVVALLRQVCASLAEAHAVGLVHRDVKPQNVMVVANAAGDDLVKVLDFGLVKSIAAAGGEASLTVQDQLAGTPLYMAPEAIVTPDAAGPPADLYAVSALGYFLLTGHHVFEGNTAVEIYAAHLHTAPVPPSARLGREIPAGLEALLLRGLAKSPDARPASAVELSRALAASGAPAWSDEDARAWWQEHGPRLRERRAAPPERQYATVTVARGRFASG